MMHQPRKHRSHRYLRYALPLCVGLMTLIAVLSGCQAETESSSDVAPPADRQTIQQLVQSQQALDEGRFNTALMLADSAAKRAPDYAGAHFQRARILSELKLYEEAETSYQKALSKDADFQGIWFNRGNNAFRQGDYDDALKYYHREKKHHASTPDLLLHLGRAHDALGHVDSATYYFQRSLQQDSTNAQTYARLGRLYQNQGQLEAALQQTRQAYRLDSSSLNYRYLLGAQLFRLGKNQEAIDHLKAVAEARPWHFSSHYNLSQALMRLGREQEAQRYAQEADHLREVQAAVERHRTKAENMPREPKLWAQLGDTLRSTGQYDKALEAYNRALFLAPENPAFRNNVALLHHQLGDRRAAISHYRSLLQQYPRFVDGWFNLGVIYAQEGDRQKARQAWQRVLQIAPNHQTTKAYLARLNDMPE